MQATEGRIPDIVRNKQRLTNVNNCVKWETYELIYRKSTMLLLEQILATSSLSCLVVLFFLSGKFFF